MIDFTVAPLEHDPEMTKAALQSARPGVLIVVMPIPLMGTTAPANSVVTMAQFLFTIVLL